MPGSKRKSNDSGPCNTRCQSIIYLKTLTKWRQLSKRKSEAKVDFNPQASDMYKTPFSQDRKKPEDSAVQFKLTLGINPLIIIWNVFNSTQKPANENFKALQVSIQVSSLTWYSLRKSIMRAKKNRDITGADVAATRGQQGAPTNPGTRARSKAAYR